MAFCDGLYINVMPRKPDQPNGTALISEKPGLSKVLKECVKPWKHTTGRLVPNDLALFEIEPR